MTGLWDDAGQCLQQYTYSPYGQLVAVDDLSDAWESAGGGGWEVCAAPGVDTDACRADYGAGTNRVAHQGLFFERFDGILAGTYDPLTGPALLPYDFMAVRPNGLYYNRNRWYQPHLGRFTSPDPNATATPLLQNVAFNGETPDPAFASGFDLQTLYGDGANLFLFVGANPVNGIDPLGLDVFDDAIEDLVAQYVGALAQISSSAAAVGLGVNTALDIASSLLGFDLVASAGNILSGEGTFSDYLEVGLAVGGGTLVLYKAIKATRKALKARRATKLISGLGNLPKPSVSHPKLRNIVNDLYHGAGKSDRIGSGSTADAIRYERITGERVKGRLHTQKGQEAIGRLRKWLTQNPHADQGDRAAAKILLDDLVGALQGR